MTLSKLATEVWPLGKTPAGANRFHRRPSNPRGFIVHHAAGTSDEGLKSQFVARHRELSSNYAMRRNGDIVAILHEEYRPFTSSSAKADNWGITIEMVNQTVGPEWRGSDRQLQQLARLIAECATRWAFPINRSTVIGHREVRAKFGQGIATACPGPWWWSRMDELVALARKYQAEASAPAKPATPTPTTPPPPPAKTADEIEEHELMSARDDIINAILEETRPVPYFIEEDAAGRRYTVHTSPAAALIQPGTGFILPLNPPEGGKRGQLDSLTANYRITTPAVQAHGFTERTFYNTVKDVARGAGIIPRDIPEADGVAWAKALFAAK